MLWLKLLFSVCIGLMAYAMAPMDAFAWGPGVHTVVALGVFRELGSLLPSIGGVIRAFPMEFLYGALSADFFVGKSKTRVPGHPHHWEGGFGLLRGAGTEAEMSYAYGFLSHLAADVVAHRVYVPKMIAMHGSRAGTAHLYWELRADALLDGYYAKVARHVFKMDHGVCDDLLNEISGNKGNGLAARKRFFAQSVKIYGYFHATRDMFFPEKAQEDIKAIYGQAAVLISLSCLFAQDLLTSPGKALCLSYNPNGEGESPREKLARFLTRAVRFVGKNRGL